MEVVLIILVVIVALGVIVGVVMYNRLVKLRNRVEAGWSQIDVQLKRRYDLIPNLVETVKGYAAHERETLEAVIAARQQAISAQGVEQQAGREPTDRRTSSVVRGVRGLPRPEGQPELPRAPGGAHQHRGTHRLRASVL